MTEEAKTMTKLETKGIEPIVGLRGFDPGDYETDGCSILRGIAPPDMLADFEAELGVVVESQVAMHGVSPSLGKEPLISLFELEGAYRGLLYDSLQQLPSLARISLHVFNILKTGGILKTLGFVAPLVAWGMRVDLPGETKFMLPMHQDYAHLWSGRCARIWLALRSVDSHFGSLSIVPGSHAQGYVPHNLSDPKYPFIDTERFDPAEAQVLEFDPGDGVLFNPFLFHGSVPNKSDRVKLVMAVHIQDGGDLRDPDDADDPVSKMMAIHRERSAAREHVS